MGGILADRARDAKRVDTRLQVILAAAESNRKRVLLGPVNRARKVRFDLPALFGRTLDGESIARVEPVIAKPEIEGAVITRGAGFGDDLDAASSGARKLGRIGIFVEPDFLYFGERNVPLGARQSVDNNGGSARAHG